MISEEKLNAIKERAKIFYDKIGTVQCPYLKKTVGFNEEGFGHLLSKS
ncbi:hypothetical protein GW935_03900 [Candidatus Falkowbacteria bacterium]|nr:hypothetical protein [Candidatus Falkowbacteria bacterium]